MEVNEVDEVLKNSSPGAPKSHARGLGPLLAVGFVLTLFFAPAIFAPETFIYRDTGRMHAPMKTWIAMELAEGRLPQWNPYAGLGTPVIANATDGLFHPFTILLILLPPAAALEVWILLAYAVAAGGAYAWARSIGRGSAAAAITGLAFALSGPLVSTSDNVTYLTTYSGIPWLFAAFQAHSRRGRAGTVALVALASFVCGSAGDPQGWAIAVGLAVVLAVSFSAPGARLSALRRSMVGGLVAVLAVAPVLVPVALWVPFSERGESLTTLDVFRWNLHPWRAFELWIPEIFRGDPVDPVASPAFERYCGNKVTQNPWFLSVYLGASVVSLAAFGAVRQRRTRLVLGIACVVAWAALGHHAGFVQLTADVPVLGRFRYWEKLAALVALLVAIAAANGAEAVLENSPVATRRLAAFVGAAAAALLLVAAVTRSRPVVAHLILGAHEASDALVANLARGSLHAGLVLGLLAAAILAIGAGRLPKASALALGLVIALDLFGGNAGAYVLGPIQRGAQPPLVLSSSGMRVLTPFALKPDRWPELGVVAGTWEWGRRTLEAPWNVPMRIGSAQDYVGLREGRWARLRRVVHDSSGVHRLGLFGFTHVILPRDPRIANRIGVPILQVASSDPELPAFAAEIEHRPRAYIAAAVEQADEAAARAFAEKGGVPERTVIESPVPTGYVPPKAAFARILSDEPGDTSVEVRADARALLVLNDVFAPGWTAQIGGEEAPIVRANALVRGVWVPRGTHIVRFRYRTPGLGIGLLIAVSTSIAIGMWATVERLRARPSPADLSQSDAGDESTAA